MVIAFQRIVSYNVIMNLRPDNYFGLAFGATAFCALVALMFYPLYRAHMARLAFRFGSAQTWRTWHLWLGLGFFAFMLLHSGFRWPNNWLTGLLFYASLLITLTGGAWWLAQKYLAQSLGTLAVQNAGKVVTLERMPELHEHLITQGETIGEGRNGYFAALFNDHWLPEMQRFKFSFAYILHPPKDSLSFRAQAFRHFITDEEHEKWMSLHKLYMEKIRLEASYSLQLILKKFHLVHGTLALIVLALALVHAASVLVF